MALYDPIRDGFNEFNRMLIDAQQWDAQHQQRQADVTHRNNVLESNLVQRAFENKMAEERQLLAARGDDRAERQFKELMENNDFNQGIAIRTIEQTEATGRRQAEIWADNKKTNALNYIKLGAQVKDLTRKYTPTDVDLNGIIPNHLRKDPVYMERANAKLREVLGPDAYMEDDLFVKQYDGTTGQGTVIQLEPIEQRKYLPVIQALNAEFNDPNGNAKRNIETLTEQQAKLKSVIANTHGSGYSLAERAMAKRNVKKLESEINNQYSTFKPENAMHQYRNRAESIAAGAQWNMANGFEAEGLEQQKLAVDLWEKSIAAEKTAKKEPLTVWKRELDKNGAAVAVDTVRFNSVNEKLDRWTKDEEGNDVLVSLPSLPANETLEKPTERIWKPSTTGDSVDTKMAAHIMKGSENVRKTITPQLSLVKAGAGENAAAEQGQTFYNEIVNAEEPVMKNGKPVLNEDGTPKMRSLAPRNGPEVLQAQKEAERMLEKAHNIFADMYMKAEAIYSTPNRFGGGRTLTEDMQTWIDTVYMPKIEEAGFAYQPVEKYRYQVRGTD